MPATYYLALKDQAGAQVAVFDQFHRLQYHRHRNEPGWCKVDLDLPESRTALFDLDGQIEVRRRGDWSGATWYVDMETLHRRPEYLMLRTGQERFLSWSVGYLELLARRIGLYWLYNRDAWTLDGYLTVTATAPEIIGEFVNREAGPGAIYAGVDRRTQGLTLAAIVPAGATVTHVLRNTNLLLKIQQIAQAYGLDIQVVGNGAALFEFQVGTLLGTDRRIGNPAGNPPMVFSAGYGNITEPHYIEDRLEEVTHIFVGGEGTGLERTIYDQQDAALIADSPWNLREAFADGRSFDSESKLQVRAEEELHEYAPITDLEFRLIETVAYKYGRDWDLGDLVTATYRNVQLDYVVEAVTVTVDDTGVETIEVDLVKIA